MKDLHPFQIEILHSLLFADSLSFSELNKKVEITSDHFNFHIKQMLESGLVEKQNNRYKLTIKGKEYANRMDTEEKDIERQAKTAVLVIQTKKEGNNKKYLVQKRLKQPFYGYFMFMSGKVTWGETIEEAALRELKEETGLSGTVILKAIEHKQDYSKSTKKLLEDKLFYIYMATDLKGKFTKKFDGGENYWTSADEIKKLEKTLITDTKWPDQITSSSKLAFKEHKYYYEDPAY